MKVQTPAQKKYTARLRRYIQREGLSSVMNDTKWAEVEQALLAIPGFVPRFRVKCVLDPEPAAEQWDMSFPFHLPPRAAIEWLDLDPMLRIRRGALVSDKVTDFTGEVITALRLCNVPFSQEYGAIRVWGYLRPGVTPPDAGVPK